MQTPSPSGPNPPPTTGFEGLLERYGKFFPVLPDELKQRLNPPPNADIDTLRATYDSRRELYQSRATGDYPRPVRQQNQQLLQKLENQSQALEQHLGHLRVWRLLADASEYLARSQPGRAKHRLTDATAQAEANPLPANLSEWLLDLTADLSQFRETTPAVIVTPRFTSPSTWPFALKQPTEIILSAEPPPERFTAVGLPPGLEINETTGCISGQLSDQGQYSVIVEAHLAGQVGRSAILLVGTNATSAKSKPAPTSVKVAAPPEKIAEPVPPPPTPPRFISPPVATARVGSRFEYQIETDPTCEEITVENLPEGLTLEAATGHLSGIPKIAGTIVLSLTAHVAGQTGQGALVISVQAPPPPPQLLLPPEVSALVGRGFSCSYAVWPADSVVTASALPAGVTFDPTKLNIAGIPESAGDHQIELTATGPGGTTLTQLCLKVAAAPTLTGPAPRIEFTSPDPFHAGTNVCLPIHIHGGPAEVKIDGQPAGLSIDGDGNLSGIATAPGRYDIDVFAFGATGGVGRAKLSLTVWPALPEIVPASRFTWQRPDGRRVHVFAEPVLRLGRNLDSDFPVAACATGNPTATKSLTGEISRQHAEIKLAAAEATVRDGWSESAKPSAFGTFLDRTKVPPSTIKLRSGQTLSLTDRPPGRATPNWATHLVASAEIGSVPDFIRANLATGSLHALWLRRQDDIADDLLMLSSVCNLQPLGLASDIVWLWRTTNGFAVVNAAGEIKPLSYLEELTPGSKVEPIGSIRPHDLREVLQRSTKS